MRDPRGHAPRRRSGAAGRDPRTLGVPSAAPSTSDGAADGRRRGHAGVFSSGRSVAFAACRSAAGPRRARILSRNGGADDVVRRQRCARCGLGWDIDSPARRIAASCFRSDVRHTGFTGTSLWPRSCGTATCVPLESRIRRQGRRDAAARAGGDSAARAASPDASPRRPLADGTCAFTLGRRAARPVLRHRRPRGRELRAAARKRVGCHQSTGCCAAARTIDLIAHAPASRWLR